MRPYGWFLCGVLLLGCDRSRAPSSSDAMAADPPIQSFPSDSQGEEVREIALGSKVWAVNRGAPSLARYGQDGELEWHGLELGDGPDQVRSAWSVVVSGDTSFAWDPMTRRLLRIEGARIVPEATFDFVTTHFISGRASGMNFGHPGRLRRYRSGWITYATERDQSHDFDLTQMVLLHFDRAGRVIDTLADLRSSPVFTDAAAWRASGPKELIPVPLWDVCGGERLVYFDPEGPLLWWERPGGRGRDSLRFEFRPTEIPDEFLRAHMYWQMQVAAQGHIPEDTLRAWLDQTLAQERWIFGKIAPFAVKLFCDGSGRVWLERFSVEATPRGLSRTWLVVDPATRSMREVRLPSGFQALAADSVMVYGAMTDSGGVSSIGRLEIGEVLR